MLVDLQRDVRIGRCSVDVGCMRAARTYPYRFCIPRGFQNYVAANMPIRAGSGRLEFRAYAGLTQRRVMKKKNYLCSCCELSHGGW